MGCAAKIRVLIVDDYAPFREGFRGVLDGDPEIAVVGEADSGRQAVEFVRAHQPDVVLLDIRMRGMNGIEAIPLIRACSPKTAVVMVTMYGDKHYVSRSFQKGARGFLLKDAPSDELLGAIRTVNSGGYYCAPDLAEYAEAAMEAGPGDSPWK